MNLEARTEEIYKLILEIIYSKEPDLPPPLYILTSFAKECFISGEVAGLRNALELFRNQTEHRNESVKIWNL